MALARTWEAATVTDDRASGQVSTSGTTAVDLPDADLATFLEMSAEIFGVYHQTEGLVWWNPAFPATLGFTDEEFARLDIREVIHADDRAELDRVVRSVTGGEEISGIRTRYRAKGGTWRTLEWTATGDPATDLVYGAARDTTRRRSATQALRSSRQSLQTIIDHSPSAIFAKDLQGRYVLVNNEFLRTLGVSRDVVLGRTPAQVWPDLPLYDEVDRQVLETGEPITHEMVLEIHGMLRTYIVTRFALSAEGQRIGTGAISTDITARKQAETALLERERLLQTIERASPDIILIVDSDAEVITISEACEQILGLSSTLPPERLAQSIHPDDLDGWIVALAELWDHPDRAMDCRMRVAHADGHWVTMHTRGRAIVADDGTVEGAVVVGRDVSEDIAFDEQLAEAVQAAERANRSKSQFLSRMSHELRTPLNSVLGFAQLLGMEELEPAQAEAVSHIVRGGRHLLDLIDEALDISRIETGRVDVTLQSVALDTVVSDAVNLARPLAERAGITVDAELGELNGAFVLADRQRLLQILLNLLSNAVKYNEANGRVVLRGERTDEGRIRIHVSDTGLGIPPDRVHRVFDAFDRLGAEYTRVEGTGVGLTLSKQLVERMGGTISVVSTLGVGSTFSVELDAALPPDEAGASPTVDVSSRPQRPVRILYVEDNVTNRRLLQHVLGERPGVELVVAATGTAGLALARSERPDLIVLDLDLPDMSGEDVLAELRDDEDMVLVQVVVLSADATPEQRDRLRSRGVVAYLTKPFDINEVIDVVDVARRRAWS
jgi:PAS domain S-box-containing protein